MNREHGPRLFLLTLLVGAPALAAYGFRENPAPRHPSPAAPRISSVPVEIFEKGHPVKIAHLAIHHPSVPETGTLFLAPLSGLLLLRRQR